MSEFNTNAFELALAALKRSIDASTPLLSDASVSLALKETLRAGVIQHFEFTYELSWKTLRRKLVLGSSDSASVSAMSYQELIREGAQQELIANAEQWLQYRHKRNLTSHTYHLKTAEEVYHSAVAFYGDALDLLLQLQKKSS